MRDIHPSIFLHMVKFDKSFKYNLIKNLKVTSMFNLAFTKDIYHASLHR